ncbi:Uncharacterised protein [Burkholderia pseudomallei]|nr:Uncharacterised protein [Burkholderia pseudomallei]CAJ7181575.1 Uncharacterised protein [Burkholderia pseudomallei]CAJ7800671.1 Uncharacterised protein [Burkholderia pseudomallei]CAJ7996059.1 Uncharacterised protein [Burkholderia pseudomallei]CAJ9185633.1 Uncharacterised protein [Burkholderia pseudomallei]
MYPITACSHSGNTTPTTEKLIIPSEMITTQNVKVRSRNRLSSTTGCASPSSQISSDTSDTPAAIASAVISDESNHPRSCPRSSIACSEPTPITSSTIPGTSIGLASPREARGRSISVHTANENSPIGRLIRKIHGHEKLSISQPPTTGPKIGASSTVIPHSASANVRFAGGNARIRIVCDSGTIGPENSPCSARHATSTSRSRASPHSSDVSVNRITDATNSRCSPTRRASQPVSGTAIAAATEYELITHVPWLFDTPRLPEIAGTATFATVESSTSMNVASDSANVSSASFAPRSGRAAAGSRAPAPFAAAAAGLAGALMPAAPAAPRRPARSAR